MGYHRAGFTDITGVDNRPTPRYPFAFVEADALEFLRKHGREYHVIHASPPCQRYSSAASLPNVRRDHPDLLGATRNCLIAAGKPWAIENVERAPMRPPAVLPCGLMFRLKVFRHRWFESSVLLFAQPHEPHGVRRIGVGGYVCVAGNGGGHSSGWLQRRRYVPRDHRNKKAWQAAMGVDWMTRNELSQAIPPAYTHHVGLQLARIIRGV